MHGNPPWHKGTGFPHASQQAAAIAAMNAHYPFLFWNGRVYLLEPFGEGAASVVACHDTGWFEYDINYFTVRELFVADRIQE